MFGHFYGIESFNHKSAKAIGKGMHPDKVKQGLIDVKNYFKEQSEENLKYLNEANYVDKELTSKMKNLNVKDENINKKPK